MSLDPSTRPSSSGASASAGSSGVASTGGTGRAGTVPAGLRLGALLVAGGAAAATLLVWRYFVGTAAGQAVDEAAFEGADYGKGKLWVLAEPVLDVVSVSFVVVGLIVAVGIALVRRRWNLALQVVALVGGANLTTQVLKKVVLDRPSLGYGGEWGNSLPSGHTTVAASVSVALVLAVPRRQRPLVALVGGVYTAATGISTLVGQWHRPSDVIAALLVVLSWGALVCAFSSDSSLDQAGESPGRSTWRSAAHSTGLVAWLLVVVGLVAGAVAGWALKSSTSSVTPGNAAGDHAGFVAYVGGAAGVVAVTAVVFALVLLMRQGVSRPR